MIEAEVTAEIEESTMNKAAQRWLRAFESAVNTGDRQISDLFSSNGWWRDVLAFTWTIVAFTGKERIEAGSAHALARWTLKPFRCETAEVRCEFSTVETLELNYWPATTFHSGAFDASEHRWSATVQGADGALRELRPRHS